MHEHDQGHGLTVTDECRPGAADRHVAAGLMLGPAAGRAHPPDRGGDCAATRLLFVDEPDLLAVLDRLCRQGLHVVVASRHWQGRAA